VARNVYEGGEAPIAGDCNPKAPAVRAFEKGVIVRLFRGSTSFGFPPVDAHSVVYRVSNVHITSRNCDLSLGSRKPTLTGREANELGATTALPGVPSQEAAGSSTESISHDRPEDHAAGGGADCFETAQ